MCESGEARGKIRMQTRKISEGYCKGGQTEMKEPTVVIEGKI